MAGLPGTGKSTLARELAARTAGRVVSKDDVRHALFSADEIEYSSRQDDFCLQVMLDTAGYLLLRNPGRYIFLDGRPFSRRYQIENVLSAADAMRQPWRILECVCSEETARRRLEADVATGAHAFNSISRSRRDLRPSPSTGPSSIRISRWLLVSSRGWRLCADTQKALTTEVTGVH
jgi:predicted kinase